MRTYLPTLVLLLIIAGSFNAAARDPDNPKPANDDVVLPLPGDRKIVFRQIFLGVEQKPWAVREFTMGDGSSGEFSETPTQAAIGGAFVGTNGGKSDWYYLLEKYDVTVGQYNAVMGLPPPDANQGNLPKTRLSLAEVTEFVEKLNEWFYANAKDALPKQDGLPGFARLPTEPEWEFAARGGVGVTASVFDQKRPYTDDLARYEWFSGPRSSHDQIKEVGLLEPNPLGLYDMLGDVRQLVSTLFQAEYVQGRIGGLTTRGGDYRTPEKDVRSSLRTEQPLFTSDLTPARRENVGLRLVIGSNLFASPDAYQALAAAWPDYAKSRFVPTAENRQGESTSAQTDAELAKISGVLDQIEKGLAADSAAKQEIGIIRSSFSDIRSGINHSEKLFSKGGVRLASIAATRIMQSSIAAVEWKKNLDSLGPQPDPDDQKATSTKLDNALQNLHDAEALYGESLADLSQADPQTVQDEFTDWISTLKQKNIPQQADATQIAESLFVEYSQTKRLDMDKWVQQLANSP